MKICLVLIAIGERYWQFARDLIASAKEFFPEHDVLLFTDTEQPFEGVVHQVLVDNCTWPGPTLNRYHYIMRQEPFLRQYDYIFYSDVDMRFVAPVSTDEICGSDLTITEHPGFFGVPGTFENKPKSTAFVAKWPPRPYYCGGFNGGTADAYLAMAKQIRHGIDRDKAFGIVAVWHDESHLNRYVVDHPPSTILGPGFCYPDQEWRVKRYYPMWCTRSKEFADTIVPKLLAIEKSGDKPL